MEQPCGRSGKGWDKGIMFKALKTHKDDIIDTSKADQTNGWNIMKWALQTLRDNAGIVGNKKWVPRSKQCKHCDDSLEDDFFDDLDKDDFSRVDSDDEAARRRLRDLSPLCPAPR